MFGRIWLTFALNGVYLWSVELYPTVIRYTVVLCSIQEIHIST